MFSDYGKERLKIFGTLFKKKAAMKEGWPWVLEPDKIRFKLGKRLGDLKIPYHLGIEDEECVQLAINELLQLYKKRHETVDPGKQEQNTPSVALKVFSVKSSAEKEKIELGPQTYRIDIFQSGSIEEKLALDIITTTPLIDCSMLKVWLSPEGKGKALFNWCSTLLEKSLIEEARNEEGEMTSYLALLAIIKTIRKRKKCITDFRVKRISYERLDMATGTILYQVLKTALDEIFRRLKTEKSIFCSPKTETILKTALTQQDFLLIHPIHYTTSLNQYYISDSIIEAFNPHVPEFNDWPKDPEEFVTVTALKVALDTNAMSVIEGHYYNVILREEIIEYLMTYDVPGSKDNAFLYEIYLYDRQSHMRDAKTVAALQANLSTLETKFTRDGVRLKKIRAITSTVANMKLLLIDGHKGELSKIKKFLPDLARNYLAFRLDCVAGKSVAISLEHLNDRRLKFSADLLQEEFNHGRLYRFSNDTRPVLKALTIDNQAQLVVDIRDFTKMTLKFKEVAMAEFMKDKFYDPILINARKYNSSHLMHGREHAIELSNLPGDMAVFSGNTAGLVALAKDIQTIARQYREEVKKKFLPMLDKLIENFNEKFRAEQERLALENAENGENSETLISITGADELIGTVSRKELEADITEEMEAGLFISYGSKAETIIIDGKDGFSNKIKVAIGDKINEASKGTKRSLAIMEKLKLRLEEERKKTKKKDLFLPFKVYIDKIYSISIPLGLEERLAEEITDREKSDKSLIVKMIEEEYQEDLEKLRLGIPETSLKVLSVERSIHNRGQAMSAEAFKAYRKEVKATRFFFKRKIKTNDLDDAIKGLFYFDEDMMELWFGVQVKDGKEDVEIFHRTGDITFESSGEQGPVTVYELLDTASPLFIGIKNIYFKDWYQDAKASLENVVKDLP